MTNLSNLTISQSVSCSSQPIKVSLSVTNRTTDESKQRVTRQNLANQFDCLTINDGVFRNNHRQ